MNKRIKSIVSTMVFFAIVLGGFVLCIAVPDEEYSKAERRELAHFPEATKENIISGQFSKEFESYTVRELLVPVFKGGECVYSCPPIAEIQSYCKSEIDTLWDEVKRFENPHGYYVDLSEKLWNIKQSLLRSGGKCEVK